MRAAALRTARDLARKTAPTPGDVRRQLAKVCDLLDEDLQRALLAVVAEALDAEDAHGPLPVDAHKRMSVLTEEVLELQQATNDHSWTSPRPDVVRKEAVQVSATALRMVVMHDRLTISPRPRNA